MDLKEFMRRYYETYNSADPQALAGFYHPEVRLLSANGELVGRDALLQTYQFIIERFQDQITPRSLLAEGDRVVVEIHDELVARVVVPDFLGQDFRAGASLVLSLCGIYQVVDGQIRTVTLYQR